MRYGLILLCAFFFAGGAQAAPTGVCPDGRIDINKADASAFTALKGIGDKKAAKIVADRAQNGPFEAVGALTRVKGVGEKSVARWSALVTTDCASKVAIVPAKLDVSTVGPTVNVNTATAAELSTVKGIGAKTAAAIVALRDQKKGFKSLDELTEVKGIGAGKLAKIRATLTLK